MSIDKEIMIGIIAAIPGIIALILYFVDMYRDRYRLSIVKNKASWEYSNVNIGGKNLDELYENPNSSQVSQHINDSLSSTSIYMRLTFSNIGRRSTTITNIIIKILDYEVGLDMNHYELIPINSGESLRKKLYFYTHNLSVTAEMLESDVTVLITDHRGKVTKKNIGVPTI